MGVFPSASEECPIVSSLPHARGGVSPDKVVYIKTKRSSPRPWGCFWRKSAKSNSRKVFPTPVGVFPDSHGSVCAHRGLPHARGGVSRQVFTGRTVVTSSPRPWGCFWRDLLTARRYWSSPRPWGCFRVDPGRAAWVHVFPTPVGVFPWSGNGPSLQRRLPHARGGVSLLACPASRARRSSPRPWGCFPLSGY